MTTSSGCPRFAREHLSVADKYTFCTPDLGENVICALHCPDTPGEDDE
jgi:hypothetical protein